MKIEKNKVVAVTYSLSIPDEENDMDVVEVVDDTDPMYFIYGMSGLPEGFEDNLQNLSDGDSFNFTIEPESGYGEFDPNAVVEIPKEIFKMDDVNEEELLAIGNIVPMTNEEGDRLQGQVVRVTDEHVIMDFNHPLAGKTMHFEGKVVAVRDATPDELEHGHVHSHGGVHH